MANTYYKYVEREVDSQVNWAEIGKNMSDMLKNESKRREDLKSALDQATRDELKVLADLPTGQSESGRVMAIKYGDNASQFLRMQDQLLKSGQLKLADYMVGRQNIIDDTENLFTMLRDYQSVYGEKMDRYKTDGSQRFELEAMDIVEGFGNFSKSGAYIDPATGRVSMAMMDEQIIDGKKVYTMSKKPGKVASINTVKGLLEAKYDKFNPNPELDAISNSIGSNIQTIRSLGRRNVAGEVMSVTDVLSSVRQESAIRQEIKEKGALLASLAGSTDKKDIATREKLVKEINEAEAEISVSKAIFDFEKFETNRIEMMFANEWNRLSVLTDSMPGAPDGNPYKFVYSKEEQEADPEHNIYMKPSDDNNGTLMPDFTEEQEQASLEFMRNQLRSRYDYEEKRQMVNEYEPPVPRSEASRAAAAEKKLLEDGYYYWNLIRTGTDAQKLSAVKWLNESNFLTTKGIESLGLSDDGKALVVNKRGSVQTVNGVESMSPSSTQAIPLYAPDGTELGGSEWMGESTIAFGTISPEDAKRFGKGGFRKAEAPASIRAYRKGGGRSGGGESGELD